MIANIELFMVTAGAPVAARQPKEAGAANAVHHRDQTSLAAGDQAFVMLEEHGRRGFFGALDRAFKLTGCMCPRGGVDLQIV